jgi:two-component system cell cycle response regulator DivK
MTNTVLIVDDYADARSFLKFLFELGGYRVVEATDGQEAIEQAIAEKPDLILMDMSMPKVDGITASRIIKEKMSHSKVPTIIGVTAHGSDYNEKAIEAGCKTVINKPVSFDVLDSMIAMYMIN